MLIDSYRFASAAGPLPAFVGATSASSNGGAGNLTVTPHASTSTGDLLVVMLFTDGTGGDVDASGWTELSALGSPDGYLFYRTHDGSASYTFTRPVTTQQLLYVCSSFSDAAYDTHTFSAPTFSVAPTGSAVVPSAEALILVGWGNTTADNSSVVPSGFTDIPDVGSGGMAMECGYSDSTYTGGVSTGALAASTNFSGGRFWRACTVSIIGA
jgi:hypothetical protein